MNSFGPSSSQRYPLYDPRWAREARARFRRDRVALLDRANSIYIPTGRYPTRGWLLLDRASLDAIDTYGTNFELDVGDPAAPDNVGTLGSLAIVQSQCVTRGLATDPSALYLVEVTDGRGVLSNHWFQYPLNAAYNIRSPAYPQAFQTSSMDGATTWTWSRMLQDIWETMGTVLGAWPGLPTTPTGTPEGFWFVGVPAWDALCDVLDHLGLTVACDLTAGNPFTIVYSGADDAAFTALQAKYGGAGSPHYRLEDDLEWLDTGSGRVPSSVVVLFRRRNSVYGTEETVYYGNDATAQQWNMKTAYSVTVSAPAAFLGAAGKHHIWSDFTVRYDQDSQPLAADTAVAATIAAERVTQYFARIYSSTLGWMTQTYAGALPFTTGAQVDGVCYYQDYIDQRRQGWKTKIARGSCPPFSEVCGRD